MIAKKEFASDEEWREYRRQSIGGSDIGTILGFNKYKTPLQWLEDRRHNEELPQSILMKLGHLLEPAVAELFKDETGCVYDDGCEKNIIYENDKYPNFHATPDRIGTLNGERFVLEIKTTSTNVNRSNVPQMWLMQLQTYLALLDVDKGYIAWLVAGRDFDFIEVNRNSDLCDAMFAKAWEFWQSGGGEGVRPTMADLETIYPTSEARTTEISADAYASLQDYLRIKARIKELEREADDIKARICEEIGDADTATFGGLKVASWKTTEGRKTFDVKAFKAEHPDEYESYLKQGAAYRTFRTFIE